MRLRLEYGRDGIEADVPDHATVLTMTAPPPLSDQPAEARRALDHPIGTPTLRELARGRTDAVIVVCDVTRPVPNPVVLPEMLDDLAHEGIPPSRVTILVATGTHRPNDEAELRRMLGDRVVDECPIVNHDCTDASRLRYLGDSPHGVPVWLNTVYLDASLKITLGMIEPHFMAGYAGGRKMVMPGVAGLDSVRDWHSPRFLEHPLATNGVLNGNPVHESLLAIVAMAPPDFSFDCALDARKGLARGFAGHYVEAWLAGVSYVEATVRAPIDGPCDLVITTCGGHPLDLTFYQTVKGMVGALPILKPDGAIVIASRCAEGVGNAHFREALLAETSLDGFAERLESPEWTFVPDQWQIEELAKAVRGRRVLLVSDLDPQEVPRLHVEPFGSVESAVASVLAEKGPDARVAVIPKGPYVLPVLAES